MLSPTLGRVTLLCCAETNLGRKAKRTPWIEINHGAPLPSACARHAKFGTIFSDGAIACALKSLSHDGPYSLYRRALFLHASSPAAGSAGAPLRIARDALRSAPVKLGPDAARQVHSAPRASSSATRWVICRTCRRSGVSGCCRLLGRTCRTRTANERCRFLGCACRTQTSAVDVLGRYLEAWFHVAAQRRVSHR